MTSGKLLKNYFWFLRAFQSGPISRAEISRRWLSSPLNDGYKDSTELDMLAHLLAWNRMAELKQEK